MPLVNTLIWSGLYVMFMLGLIHVISICLEVHRTKVESQKSEKAGTLDYNLKFDEDLAEKEWWRVLELADYAIHNSANANEALCKLYEEIYIQELLKEIFLLGYGVIDIQIIPASKYGPQTEMDRKLKTYVKSKFDS